uniref:Protein tyrosine phosphatase receptor type K n=1 Tax=Sinocyclocheilus grahami TaxID=75366 RepID=A0A672R5V1_SINGR
MGHAEKGGCTFDDGPAQCDYQQDPYDDFDWTHVSAQEVPYLPSDLPQGSYMMVDTSQHDYGEKARLQLPVMKENDTHCIDFNYLLHCPDGSSPGTLNILVKVNKGPLANPIWNVTSCTGKGWMKAELAVSTFWPNEYQVIFEAEVTNGRRGFIAIDDIQVLSYPCGESLCVCVCVCVCARERMCTCRYLLFHLWCCHIQRRNGEDIPVAEKKNINHRKFAASFRLREVTSQDQDLYRCVTQSERGSGVSNFAGLIVREPPRPIAPPQLLGVGPTYLLIQLNANSIFGDGPIILKEVEYRMTSGSWTETHAVNSPNYKLWHLDPDTEYEIRVLLTRPGEGGTGQPGPPLITRTKCAEPMRTPKSLKIAETQARFIAVDWESLGYNITRCHTFNVTICYHYHKTNQSKADCLEMDPKAPRHVVGNLPPNTNVSLKMILTNPEGRKESDETVIQTEEDGTRVPNLKSTSRIFSHLHYARTISSAVTESISPTLEEYDGSEASLNETATTITVLLKPAQAKGAPISAYQIVVREIIPHRARREASGGECYREPVSYQNAASAGLPYYFAAELPPRNLPEPLPFTVGDNKTYHGYWNAPLAPRKNYNIYFQAVSRVEKESKTQCLKLAFKGATEEPEVIPDPAKQTDQVVKIAGISAAVLVFILLVLVAILLVKKRKLAKKRKDAIGNTRQEMTHMVNSMDRSYADQSTLHAEEPVSVTFMDSHSFSNRCEYSSTAYIYMEHFLRYLQEEKSIISCLEACFLAHTVSCFCPESALFAVCRAVDDHSRVILQPMEDDPSSDYINANYIDGYQRPSHYIATQGPVHETVYDFWRMIWQEQSACIVMVTNLVEVGRVKCYKYWPDDAEVYGDFKVTFVEVEPLAEYVVRTFTLERRGFNEVREVKQFHFTGWPDHGVPYHATGLLSFIRRVKMSNPPSAGPIVVHCRYRNASSHPRLLHTRYSLEMQSSCEHASCIKIISLTRCCPLSPVQTLNSVTPQPQPEDCSIALLPRNHDKNRFMDNLPPDRCLPFLITIDGESSNYINAALMDVTNLHFWVNYSLNATAGYLSVAPVCSVCNRCVQGCPQYWPEEGMLRYGPVQVDCISCSMDCDVISRLFRICNLTRPQEGYLMVRQFQYLGWAGHREVPASKRSFLKLILQVDKWQEECEEGDGRTIIHCLNGGGRSGMFCAISIVCEMIKRQNVVDVFHAVKSLRNSKPNMVDSPEQYRFCYDLALEYIETS